MVKRPKLHSKGRFLHYGQWQGEARPPSQKEQMRRAIDAALSERPADFADFLRRMEAAGFLVVHGRGGVIFHTPGHDRAARPMLTDTDSILKACKHCNKIFAASRPNTEFCSPQCKKRYNIYKNRGKE